MSTDAPKAPRFAPDNNEGLHAYAVTSSSWGKKTTRIKYAVSLTDAIRKYGWTRMQHTTITVRRAKPEDVT